MAGDKTIVRIGRLVVEPGGDADGREVVRAIEAELRRLAAVPGGGAGTTASGRVEAPSRALDLPVGTSAREIGSQVARTIWEAGRTAARREER